MIDRLGSNLFVESNGEIPESVNDLFLGFLHQAIRLMFFVADKPVAAVLL
jgi:hypothetical protein